MRRPQAIRRLLAVGDDQGTEILHGHPRGQGRDAAQRRRDPGEGEPAEMTG